MYFMHVTALHAQKGHGKLPDTLRSWRASGTTGAYAHVLQG